MMKKLTEFLYTFGYIHEIFHYLAARAFGLKATLGKTRVRHEIPEEDWKYLVIVLAPFSVFFVALVLVIIGWIKNAKTPYDHRRWAGWAAICLGWIGTCWNDLTEAYRFIKSDGKEAE
jgi:hypothetical protein